MNPDTLHKIQVALFGGIFLAIVALDVILLWYGFKLEPYLPELLDVLEEIARSR